MIYHKICNNPLMLDVSNYFTVVVTFGITSTCLKVGAGNINVKQDKFPAKFYCSTCDRMVEIAEVKTICMNCGKELELDGAWKPGHSSGIYCGKCIEIYENRGEKKYSFSQIVKVVSIKNKGE